MDKKPSKLGEQLHSVEPPQPSVAEIQQKISSEKSRLRRWMLHNFLRDVYMFLIMSLLLGFIYYSFFQTSEFIFYKAAALSLSYMICFEELKLHEVFKNPK